MSFPLFFAKNGAFVLDINLFKLGLLSTHSFTIIYIKIKILNPAVYFRLKKKEEKVVNLPSKWSTAIFARSGSDTLITWCSSCVRIVT